MATYRATALVLRKTKLGEADTIVTMLGSDGHQIRAVAKGVRRTRSKIGARLEPFALVELLLHRGRNLDVVGEVSTVASNAALREDWDRATAAAVVADVLDKATGDADAEPVLYELALATLEAMGQAPPAAQPALVAAFLLKAVSLLGFRPALSACARCGCTPERSACFSAEHGGALCEACGDVDPGAPRLSPAVRSALTAMLAARMVEVPELELAPPIRDETLRLLVAFARHHIPARMKSLEFVSEQAAAGTWPSVDPPSGVG